MLFKYIVGIVLIIFSIFLVVAVLFQESKKKGLGGAITGSSSDTYFGKSKTQTREKILSKLTLCVAVAFTLIVIVLYVGQNADAAYKADFDKLWEEVEAGEDTTEGEETTAIEEETTAAEEETTAAEEETTVAEEETTADAE